MRLLSILSLFVLGCNPGFAAQTADGQLEQEARMLAKQFVGQLKPRLQQAMQEGGPGYAIEVCASFAPKLADSLSAESGWLVKRVSLKSRNASRAVPDAWERATLELFDQQQAAGREASQIHAGAIVGSRYRYMQAQGVEPVCLVCHGETLTDEVRLTLQQYYPDDWATGYALGQVRGAISLSRNLKPSEPAAEQAP